MADRPIGEIEQQALTRLEQLAGYLEKMRIADYVEYIQKPGKVIYLNFIAGLARGFGMAIGFSLLATLALYALHRMVLLNLPVIGNFIADMVRIVQKQLGQ